MAPAQLLDLPQTPTSYTHKKFQGKSYAHKKFGTRTPPSTKEHQQGEYIDPHNVIPKENETITPSIALPTKRTAGDIFRPYALEDTATRKRKHHEIYDEYYNQTSCNSYDLDSKRFAPSPMTSPGPQTNQITSPAPVYYGMQQQYQFNPQTFALILQKQQAALCIGEMLKRQQNFNLHNLSGQ